MEEVIEEAYKKIKALEKDNTYTYTVVVSEEIKKVLAEAYRKGMEDALRLMK